MTFLSNTAPARIGRTHEVPGLAAGAAMACLSAIAVLLLFWGYPVNHDSAWFLIATRKWLSGATLYTDILEVNPPLNFYFTAPAVWLSQSTGIALANAWYCVMAALTFTVVLWCDRIVTRHTGLTLQARIGFAAGVAFALIVPPFNEFGQRDHLLVLFILPWLVAHLVSADDNAGRPGMARAAFAALGICLKPYFLVFALFMTAWQVLRQRSLRPVISHGNLVIAGIGLAYLAAVAVFHREYLTSIVPLGMEVYGDYGFPGRTVLLQLFTGWLIVFAAIPVAWLCRVSMPEIGALLAAITAALVSYLAQWTGYAYQAFPLACLAAVCAAWILVHPRSAGPARIIAMAVLVMFAISAKANGRYGAASLRSAATTITALHPEPRLMTMTTNPSWGPGLALQANAHWIAGYPALWTVPGIVNGLAETDCAENPARCQRLNAIARQTRTRILADLEAGKPDVVVIQARPGYIRDPGFSWNDFMTPEPGYAAFMNDYEKVSDADGISYWVAAPASR